MQTDALQLTLFDEHDLVDIASPDFPGERLVCCRNPILAAQRTRKRAELLAATEKSSPPSPPPPPEHAARYAAKTRSR